MEDKDLQEQLKELQSKYNSLVREYCNLMDENRKLKDEQNANQTSEYNSLVREYCKLQEENKKLKENFTHLKGKGYLNMNETKDDLKMQLKVLAVFIIISFLGMIGGMFLVDKTYYSTGIIITLICLWFFIGCIKVVKKITNQLQNKD